VPDTDPAADLAIQIRTELADSPPQGFLFNDHVIRQDVALERLAERLRAHPDGAEVSAAVRRALSDEHDGWVLLKLLELVERLTLAPTAPALIALAARPLTEDDRARFLSGRAAEVLLKLPLDLATRAQANAVTQAPLEDIARFRMGAQRAQQMHRPRQAEWTLLVVLMAVAVLGFALAWRALGR
jgi:hypothetical protein